MTKKETDQKAKQSIETQYRIPTTEQQEPNQTLYTKFVYYKSHHVSLFLYDLRTLLIRFLTRYIS